MPGKSVVEINVMPSASRASGLRGSRIAQAIFVHHTSFQTRRQVMWSMHSKERKEGLYDMAGGVLAISARSRRISSLALVIIV